MTPSTERVALVTAWDVTSSRSWSGVIAPMVRALREEFTQVDVLDVPVDIAPVDKLRSRLSGACGRLHLPAWSSPTARRRSAAVASQLERLPADVPVVALAATPELLLVPEDRWIVQVTDTSFAALAATYPTFSRLTPRGRRTAERIERAVSGRTDRFLAATAWSRERLVEDVGVPASSVVVARFGPAVLLAVPQAGPNPDLAEEDGGPLRLLFVASDWGRKGGDIAVGAVEELRNRGLDVVLTVVGATDLELPAHVRRLERLSPEALSAVYSSHHALLEPSRASAGGVVVTDALHHGLPVIAAAVGGLTDLVRDGRTGWLVETDGSAAPFAEAIEQRVMPSDRRTMSRAARDWARREAGWDGWARAVRTAVEERSEVRPSRPAPQG